MGKDWGICGRCGKPAECQQYTVEVGGGEVEVCEPCFFDLAAVVKAWFLKGAVIKAVESETRTVS